MTRASPPPRVPRTRCSKEWAQREAREARDPQYPIVRQCVFVRHACRVEDLPSRLRKSDHHSAGQWFLEQRSQTCWRQRINVLRVTRVAQGWKIPQARGVRVTDKTFRSCWRVKIAFRERGWAPFYIKRYARDARGPIRYPSRYTRCKRMEEFPK